MPSDALFRGIPRMESSSSMGQPGPWVMEAHKQEPHKKPLNYQEREIHACSGSRSHSAGLEPAAAVELTRAGAKAEAKKNVPWFDQSSTNQDPKQQRSSSPPFSPSSWWLYPHHSTKNKSNHSYGNTRKPMTF